MSTEEKKEDIYVLVEVTTYFYDPHGTPDEGGTVKYVDVIENGDWEEDGQYFSYNDIDDDENPGTPYVPGVSYNDDGISENDDDREYYSEDGYNCEKNWTRIKIITKEEYDKFKYIIDEYEKIRI